MGALWVLAGTTYREAVAQPLYHILIWLCAGLLLLAHPFTQFFFGQEQYAVREVALFTITLCGVAVAILSSGLVITREIEKLTVLTIFSKPVGRGTFLLGKFLGISWAAGLAMAFLYVVFLLTAWFLGEGLKGVDEAIAEPSVFVTQLDPVGAALWRFWTETGVPTFKATLLAFGQACILAAVSVCLAVHFPLVVTTGIAFLVFVLGHLSNFVYLALADSTSALVRAIGSVSYFLLPNLTNLNMVSIVCSPHAVEAVDLTWGYLARCAIYVGAYITLVLLAAIRSFAARDITA